MNEAEARGCYALKEIPPMARLLFPNILSESVVICAQFPIRFLAVILRSINNLVATPFFHSSFVCGRFVRRSQGFSSRYSRISPGWQSSSLQMASRVEKRMALAFPVFSMDRLAGVISILSANSPSEIFRRAIIMSRFTIIAINSFFTFFYLLHPAASCRHGIVRLLFRRLRHPRLLYLSCWHGIICLLFRRLRRPRLLYLSCRHDIVRLLRPRFCSVRRCSLPDRDASLPTRSSFSGVCQMVSSCSSFIFSPIEKLSATTRQASPNSKSVSSMA